MEHVENIAPVHHGYIGPEPLADAVDSITAVDSPYTIADKNQIFADASGGPITVNVPSDAQQTLMVMKTDASANAVTLVGSGGQLPFDLTNQYQSVQLISDGSNWYVV